MQCTWQKLARELALSCRGKFNSRNFFSTHSSKQWSFTTTTTECKFFSSLNEKLRSPSPLCPSNLGRLNNHEQSCLSSSSSPPESCSAPTAAQQGREASHAIALAMRDGNVADAYHIVNSIRFANSQSAFSYSRGPTPGHSLNVPNTNANHYRLVASAFTPDVLPRLPSHKLLHELIRQKMVHRASSLAEQMMKTGMKVRSRTLEALITALAQNSGSRPSLNSPPSPNPSKSYSLGIHPRNISDPSTRFAVRLLFLARQSRQRRTHRMFKTLMALCLINGEIILASLLFGVLVRDWQKRVQLGQTQQATEDKEDGESNKVSRIRTTVIYDTPFPAWSHLNDMCEYIDASVTQCFPPGRADKHPTPEMESENYLRYISSLQALANLAHQLDCRILPIGGLAGLVKTMYRYPLGDDKVWVWVRGKKREGHEPRQVGAHRYFKNTLKQLAMHLPRHQRMNSDVQSLSNGFTSSPDQVIPAPLTLQTYNTLLHYALVYARSREMAENILSHMLYHHEGMKPNVVTINVLEKSARRLGGINGQWVDRWKEGIAQASVVGEVLQSQRGDEEKKRDDHFSSVSELLEIAARFEQDPSRDLNEINNDNYTLSTRIGHLVANGKPEVVVAVVPFLLPGIAPSIHAAPGTSCHPIPASNPVPDPLFTGTTNSSDVPLVNKASQRRVAVLRAVAYGPIVLTSILNAFMKTGRTGLAEKMWELMKEAEQMSWTWFRHSGEEETKVVTPWCLGVEAYTVMLKVYGKEAKKKAGYGQRHRRDDGGDDKRIVVGWGRLKTKDGRIPERRRKKISRVQLGRYRGMKIYRTALKEEGVIRWKFDRLCSTLQNDESLRMRLVHNQLRLPQPDAHFFNAILDIVARRPGMIPRSRACWTRRRARTRLLLKRRKYLWEGRVMGFTEPDVRLKEVVRDMRRCGFRVPLLVRRLLVGRVDDAEGIEKGENRVWLKARTK